MKYLKLFKELKDDYYKDYEFTEYDNVDMSKQSIDYIKNLFKDNGDMFISTGTDDNIIDSLSGFDNVYNRLFLSAYTRRHKELIFSINQLKDEYFLIFIEQDPGYYNGKIFICDQIDGVKELLIDKGIIKK